MRSTHRILIAILFLCATPHVAAAQFGGYLPPDHWTRAAAIRVHAAGEHAAGLDPAARVHSAVLLASLFEPYGYGQRWLRERGANRAWWLQLAASMTMDRNVLGAGRFAADSTWVPPQPRADVSAFGARIHIDAVVQSRLALSAAVFANSDTQHIRQAVAELRLGSFGVWGGRRAQGYAPTNGGGFVLDGAVPVTGGGVRTLAPVTLPVLGATTFDLALGAVDSSGMIATPRVLAMRLHARPHARFDLGATRAAVFGAPPNGNIAARDLVYVLVAANLPARIIDDQVASIDARWRPPMNTLALELYGEWAVHDIDPEVVWDMPSFAFGVRVPFLPNMPSLGASLEHTQIARSCCSNPPWYRHLDLADGWTEDGMPRGHPLGGHGREWRLSADGAAYDARLVVRADAFMRRRGSENLYAPARAGRSHGAALYADGQIGGRAGVELRLHYERGSGWEEVRSLVAVTWRP